MAARSMAVGSQRAGFAQVGVRRSALSSTAREIRRRLFHVKPNGEGCWDQCLQRTDPGHALGGHRHTALRRGCVLERSEAGIAGRLITGRVALVAAEDNFPLGIRSAHSAEPSDLPTSSIRCTPARSSPHGTGRRTARGHRGARPRNCGERGPESMSIAFHVKPQHRLSAEWAIG
jgi:hypothetical protein